MIGPARLYGQQASANGADARRRAAIAFAAQGQPPGQRLRVGTRQAGGDVAYQVDGGSSPTFASKVGGLSSGGSSHRGRPVRRSGLAAKEASEALKSVGRGRARRRSATSADRGPGEERGRWTRPTATTSWRRTFRPRSSPSRPKLAASFSWASKISFILATFAAVSRVASPRAASTALSLPARRCPSGPFSCPGGTILIGHRLHLLCRQPPAKEVWG